MIYETSITLWSTLKSNLSIFIGTIFGLLAPIQPILLLVFAFIVTDTIFGVWCAKKTGQKLSSKKLSRFIGKMIVYSLAIILTYGLDKLLLGEFLLHIISVDLLATKVASLALIGAEVWSIDEKLKNVNEGQGIWFHIKRIIGIAKLIRKESDELKN